MNRAVLSIALAWACAAAAAPAPAPAPPRAQSPCWPDPVPPGKASVVLALDRGGAVRIDVLGARLFRIRSGDGRQWNESALNRYGVFARNFPQIAFRREHVSGAETIVTDEARLTVDLAEGALTLAGPGPGARPLVRQEAPTSGAGAGYDVRFSLAQGERLYGMGDVSRENIMRRGGAYEFWVRNVKAYIPIPMVLSSRGWGVLMNTTWRNTIDAGKTDPDRMICAAAHGALDYYLFCGPDYRALLDAYTSVSGRPTLLPVWGYALTYVCNQNVDAFRMVDEALAFRREGIPCDVIGLEPGWMSKYYDKTTAKQWHPDRFPIPKWASSGPHTFLGALARQGFKLSLWLCCDHDLSVTEERLLGPHPGPARTGAVPAVAQGDPDDFEKDERLNRPVAAKGQPGAAAAPAPTDEPWFEHLQKFVDQGVSAFKLDGAYQVIEHPKRAWGNGMTDEEMHNLYPVIYAKQMARGFDQHTGRRAMIYSAGGYAGVQQFVASWAGDTGGGPKPLASMLNLGLSGHSNHSCDMDVFTVEGIHFGFLQTWAQLCNWAYWRQPWLLDRDGAAAFREYARLRYRLLPYLYSTAADAAATGYPVMRAMPLVYPDDPAWDNVLGQYMLGDCLLVSAFTPEIRVPAGPWYDFFTGKRIDGPATRSVEITPRRGGALLVRAGAILPTWPEMDRVEKGWAPEVRLLVYPHGRSAFTLYEDDGVSIGHRKGESARTRLDCETRGRTLRLTIGARAGRYAGMPATRDFVATIRMPTRPGAAMLDGKPVPDATWDGAASTVTIRIPGCAQTPRILTLD